MFDGSSIEGFVRIEESDMVLRPDLDTFRVLPNGDAAGKVARVICDIYNPDGSAFAGCTRQALQRQTAKAKTLGYEMMAGVEAEFFILPIGSDGEADDDHARSRRLFDQTPVDRAEEIRRLIVKDLVAMGSKSKRGTTRWRRAATRSTSATAEALETADNSPRSDSWCGTSRTRHGYFFFSRDVPTSRQTDLRPERLGNATPTSPLFRKGANAFPRSQGENGELSSVALHVHSGAG